MEFDSVKYLKEKLGDRFKLVPMSSVKRCKTEDDCLNLLDRIGLMSSKPKRYDLAKED